MSKLYDVEIGLSSGDGALPRDSFRDGMRAHLYGHTVERKLAVPSGVVGVALFHNTGGADVVVRRGVSLPIRVARNQAIQILFGDNGGMWRVE